MKVACVQMCSGLKRDENTRQAIELITKAAEAGAEIILTPEMTNVVDKKPRRLFEELPDGDLPEADEFAQLAKKLGIHLIIGSMALALDKTFGERKAANRTYFFNPTGELLSTYDKLHMFDVDLPQGESWKESAIYQPGEEGVITQTPLAKIGHAICYDVRFPSLFRRLAQQGAEILIVPAAFTYQTGKAHWESLLRARAIETGSYVMAAAQGGVHEDGRETWGHSMIISPWGEVLDCKADTDPGVAIAEVDLSEVSRIRQQIPNLKLDRDYEISNINGL